MTRRRRDVHFSTARRKILLYAFEWAPVYELLWEDLGWIDGGAGGFPALTLETAREVLRQLIRGGLVTVEPFGATESASLEASEASIDSPCTWTVGDGESLCLALTPQGRDVFSP